MANHQLSFNKNDEWYTRAYAVEPIVKYIKSGSIVWCPFDKEHSEFVKVFKSHGFTVISSHIETGKDFFQYEPEKYDVIVSNPPYSLREPILQRLYALQKPFAMLINDAGLFDSKVRFQLLSTNKFEIMVFNRRIQHFRDGDLDTSPPFKSIYLCSGVLPTQFVFEHIAHLTPLAVDLPSAVVNHCNPVNGVHASWCTGHETASH